MNRKEQKMKLDAIKTTIKVLTKYNKLEAKTDKLGKDFSDSDNYNYKASTTSILLIPSSWISFSVSLMYGKETEI